MRIVCQQIFLMKYHVKCICFVKSSIIWNCRLMKIVDGDLWVNLLCWEKKLNNLENGSFRYRNNLQNKTAAISVLMKTNGKCNILTPPSTSGSCILKKYINKTLFYCIAVFVSSSEQPGNGLHVDINCESVKSILTIWLLFYVIASLLLRS